MESNKNNLGIKSASTARVFLDKDGKRVMVGSKSAMPTMGAPLPKPGPKPVVAHTTVQHQTITKPVEKPAPSLAHTTTTTHHQVSHAATPKPTTHTKKSKKKIDLKKHKKTILIACGIVAFIAVIAIIMALVKKAPQDTGNTTDGDTAGEISTAAIIATTTEEDNEITKQVLDKYAEVEIGGYERIEDESGVADTITISVKNISEEKVNLAIDIIATDNDDNLLDVTSLYAEGIEPGQTQVFQAFAASQLTAEQLQSAKFKVNKAYTYITDTGEQQEIEATDIVEQVEVPEEQPIVTE